MGLSLRNLFVQFPLIAVPTEFINRCLFETSCCFNNLNDVLANQPARLATSRSRYERAGSARELLAFSRLRVALGFRPRFSISDPA